MIVIKLPYPNHAVEPQKMAPEINENGTSSTVLPFRGHVVDPLVTLVVPPRQAPTTVLAASAKMTHTSVSLREYAYPIAVYGDSVVLMGQQDRTQAIKHASNETLEHDKCRMLAFLPSSEQTVATSPPAIIVPSHHAGQSGVKISHRPEKKFMWEYKMANMYAMNPPTENPTRFIAIATKSISFFASTFNSPMYIVFIMLFET